MGIMKVKVKILPFEHFNEMNSKKELEIDLPEKSTINALLLKLSGIFGELFQKYIYNSERLSLIQNTILILNDDVMQKTEDLNTELHDGDEIIIGRAYTQG